MISEGRQFDMCGGVNVVVMMEEVNFRDRFF